MAERITGHTELIGLMAYPIRHSSSPAMHNEAFAYLGLDYAYLAFEVDNSTLEDAVKGLRALKMVGSNVSMPNKTVVGQYLDKLSPAAELCGAVNTIVNEDGVLTGHITDGIGFMQALKDNDIDVIGKKMTIAGAGGAAAGDGEPPYRPQRGADTAHLRAVRRVPGAGGQQHQRRFLCGGAGLRRHRPAGRSHRPEHQPAASGSPAGAGGAAPG